MLTTKMTLTYLKRYLHFKKTRIHNILFKKEKHTLESTAVHAVILSFVAP